MMPFFLFVPDARPRAGCEHRPAHRLLQSFGTRCASCRSHRDMLLFLIARAIYVDGLSAIFTFGGIYGASVFGWQAFELGLFGIILTLTGAIRRRHRRFSG